MKRRLIPGIIGLLALQAPLALLAQQSDGVDSVFHQEMNEVVVTATRNERKLGNVAVPVSVINQKTIQQAGSLRLKDILQEQTGLFLTSGFGTGVQMQGLSPDYTLILIDGEPMVGRTAGVLDLNRLSVGNVKKIEIVKGPSSSLYGSEALAGVINIITDKSYQPEVDAGIRYGTYNTIDANVHASGKIGKLGVNAYLNSYSTDGYSLRPHSVERSQLPIWRASPQLQLNYAIDSKTSLSLSTRYSYEHIKNELAVTNNGQVTYSTGREINKDLNIIPSITHQFSARVKSTLRLYGTRFEGSQKLSTTTGDGYDDYFRQQFYRVEDQTDISFGTRLSVVAGAGFIQELVNSNRYDSKESQKKNEVKYGFVQAEWQALKPLTLIGGFRYDDNRLYASAFSPKLAALLKVSDRFSLQASFGKGFKAPDFRQLYLNFTNTAAGGYSVYGTLEAQHVIEAQQQAGLIAELYPDYYKLKTLKPEFSTGMNAGFTAYPLKNLQWKLNFFRNDITDLIEARQVAARVDNSQIFSYINVQRAYTQGMETNVDYRLNRRITVTAGYQLLFTADKDELAKVKEGNYYYTRDANNFSIPVKRSDYLGLPNRSRHMANLKITYEPESHSWFATARTIYRSRWVVFDRDGNGIYNQQDEFANGFALVNLSAGKTLFQRLRVQAGIDNLFDYVDADNLPNMPGRTVYVSLNYQFIKHPSKKNNTN